VTNFESVQYFIPDNKTAIDELGSFLAFEQLTALIEQIAQLVYDRRYLIKLLSFYRFVWQVRMHETLRFVNYWLPHEGNSSIEIR
jgi:hypothetical protein